MFGEMKSIPDLARELSQHPGAVFPQVVTVVLLATVVLIVLHLVMSLIGGRSRRPRRGLNILEKLIYLGILASVFGLAFTSFFTVLQFGTMKGWWLFAHMFGAGALVGLLPLLAIIWAGPSRFGRGPAGSEEQETYAPKFFWMPKLMFWLLLASGSVVILTMLVSMLPIFGTDGLHALLDIHRYAGLMTVVVLLLHFYCVLLQRAKLR
jgi:hypothetical protein